MRILITGGTGFIGSRMARQCQESGHSVTVFGRENNPVEVENARLLREAGVRLVVGSITDSRLLPDLVRDIDVVFHLAAVQHEMNVPDQVFFDVNVEGTRNLLEVCVAAGVRRFVHGSTIGVYGSLSQTVDESVPCRPDNIYGITKLEGEKLALSYNDRIPVVAIRISEVYGPGDRRLLKLFSAIQRGVFMMIGSGKNFHHPIYVDDLIHGRLLASCSPEAPGQVLLLPGRDIVTTEEMVNVIASELNAKRLPFRASLAPMLLLATVTEKTLRPLGIQPPLHRRRMDFFRKSFTLSGKRAAELLGFNPQTDFRAGVARTAAWYREKGYLK